MFPLLNSSAASSIFEYNNDIDQILIFVITVEVDFLKDMYRALFFPLFLSDFS